MNKVFLIGNLTRDPELAETASGVSVCHFTIAVNRNYTSSDGERQTDFFNCTAWRGIADNVARFCKKGNKVAVSGSVQMRVWTDNDGNKHQAVDIIAQDVEFLSSKNRNEDDEYYERGDRNAAPPRKKPAQQQMQVFDDDMGDIPF